MKKILFVASVTSHILQFHIPYLKYFYEHGYEVHVASFGRQEIPYAMKHFNVPFERSPLSLRNIKAYRELKRIIDEEKYDIIECNTPTASVLTRLAAKKARENGTRVIYIAHGFHFFKGAPLKNWTFYYPVEKFLSKRTDDLITINEEDYEFAKKKLKAKNIHHIHGIGINQSLFQTSISEEEKNELRNEFQLTEKSFVLFFAGELNKNKNQIAIINALKEISADCPNMMLLFAGVGPLEAFLKKKVKEYHLEDRVKFLGYRTDVLKILQITDLYISMSRREGLPINILEAKMMGVPLIVSDARGQRELVQDHSNGFVVPFDDLPLLARYMKMIYENPKLPNEMTARSKNGIEKYYLENVEKEMKEIYHI